MSILAAHLTAPKNLEVVDKPEPESPAEEEVLVRVKAVGICGSDLLIYATGAIGYIKIEGPFTLGHEFMGEVVAWGDKAQSGLHGPLSAGQRVAVEPAVPCLTCELCEAGHPNLCPNHYFYGLYPTHGALCEELIVPARNCFPISDEIIDGGGTLLETLGVAIHALDLAKLKVAKSVAVIGCGPVGLLIQRLAVVCGASAVYAMDPLAWRTELAKSWGATEAWPVKSGEALSKLQDATVGRGVDVVIEAAWADDSVDHAMEMAAYGGRVVLVGIPPDDKAGFSHSIARRKGLTIMMARRMKHTYPRAIQLASGDCPDVPLDELISEYVSLSNTGDAFAKNYAYAEGVNKLVIRCS